MNYSKEEKQLITTLRWFRSKYALYQGLEQERQATKEAIESFGESWIGKFKLDWSNAYDALINKGVFKLVNNEFLFTEKGEALKEVIEDETPFYKYEYDNFFGLELTSKSHKRFCEKVYGKDLSQHGLINEYELSYLIEEIRKNNYSQILDLGCGNGMITEYLSTFTDSKIKGIDISDEAIRIANARNEHSAKLSFEIGNIDKLRLPQEFYDAILSLDTLYYSNDLENLLMNLFQIMKEDGVFYVYYSQWISDLNSVINLKVDQTNLAKALVKTGFEFTSVDLSESGLSHWKLKLKTLEEMKEAFIQEGNVALWNYRYREAFRYANWDKDKYSRYFYKITKNKPE